MEQKESTIALDAHEFEEQLSVKCDVCCSQIKTPPSGVFQSVGIAMRDGGLLYSSIGIYCRACYIEYIKEFNFKAADDVLNCNIIDFFETHKISENVFYILNTEAVDRFFKNHRCAEALKHALIETLIRFYTCSLMRNLPPSETV